MSQNSEFRNFCIRMYFEHQNEILNWQHHVCTEDMVEYIRRNKYFLKALYKSKKS